MKGKGFGGEAAGRRRYRRGMGRCQDCGHELPLTKILWWASGEQYLVCSECIRPYRRFICHPEPEWKR